MINFDFFTILVFLILIFNKEFFKSYSNEVIFYIKIILLESRLLLLNSNNNCLQLGQYFSKLILIHERELLIIKRFIILIKLFINYFYSCLN